MKALKLASYLDVQTVSIALAGIGIFIAAVNSIISSRKADQQRQMELFTEIYGQVLTDNFAQHFAEVLNRKAADFEDFDTWMEFVASDPKITGQESYINRLIAYLCVVINKGLIDIDLVDDIIAEPVIQYWDRVQRWFQEWRKRRQDPTLGDDIEAAYHKLKRRRDQQVALALQQQTTVGSQVR